MIKKEDGEKRGEEGIERRGGDGGDEICRPYLKMLVGVIKESNLKVLIELISREADSERCRGRK